VRFKRVDLTTVLDEYGHLFPRAFIWNGSRREVTDILDRWYEGGSPGRPAVRYFKVRTGDGSVFILRHAAIFGAWAVLEG
jgi:hypothetical protein